MRHQASLFAAIILLAATSRAEAHLGHVAEVAGHSHWIGLAAVTGAAAIAGAIGLLSGDKSADDADTDTDTEGETA